MTDTSEQLARAFIAGAEAVHRDWIENPSDCPRGDPEFLEAALDYVASLDCIPCQLDAEVVARVRGAMLQQPYIKRTRNEHAHWLIEVRLSDVKAMLAALA